MQAADIWLLDKVSRTIFIFYFNALLFWLPSQILDIYFILDGGVWRMGFDEEWEEKICDQFLRI